MAWTTSKRMTGICYDKARLRFTLKHRRAIIALTPPTTTTATTGFSVLNNAFPFQFACPFCTSSALSQTRRAITRVMNALIITSVMMQIRQPECPFSAPPRTGNNPKGKTRSRNANIELISNLVTVIALSQCVSAFGGQQRWW